MKRLFLTIALAALVVGSAQAITVEMQPPELTIMPSTIFVVDLMINDADQPGVEVVNVVVSYDPSLVNAIGAEEGAFLSDQQAGEYLMEFTELDNVGGIASYTVARLGPLTSVGSGVGASLTFHCERDGLVLLDWLVILADQNGEPIIIQEGVIPVEQIPEPMTLVLIGGALAALGVVARKRG